LAIERYYTPGGFFHLADQDSAAIDELLAEIKSTPPDQAAPLYAEMGQLLADGAYTVPVCEPENHMVARPEVGGLDDKRAGEMSGNQPDYRFLWVAAD
ncbi:MAG TPA: hypothetical protein PLV68_00860, partial [Ilumatobacteraceae bacterium]|nr:hypothetical protein [Ilumatobacteraceae bacterium]